MASLRQVLGMATLGTAVVYTYVGVYTGGWTTAFMGVPLAWIAVFMLQ
jgi:hypothetical protein